MVTRYGPDYVVVGTWPVHASGYCGSPSSKYVCIRPNLVRTRESRCALRRVGAPRPLSKRRLRMGHPCPWSAAAALEHGFDCSPAPLLPLPLAHATAEWRRARGAPRSRRGRRARASSTLTRRPSSTAPEHTPRARCPVRKARPGAARCSAPGHTLRAGCAAPGRTLRAGCPRRPIAA